jgi:hypothetical protein
VPPVTSVLGADLRTNATVFFVERFVDAFFVDRVFVVVAISLY